MVGSVVPILAPVAATVGGFIGGVVGKVAGSVVGQAIKRGAQKIVEVAKPVLKSAWEGIKSVGSAIFSGVKNLFSSILAPRYLVWV
jgi:tetrahydromethanopterin S-methyltransferase subunit C